MQPELHDKRWSFKRNPSWLASAKIGLVHGLWWFPTSLFREIASLLKGVFAGAHGALLCVGVLVLSIFWITGCHLVFIGYGLAGFITEDAKTPADLPSETSRNPQDTSL